MPRALALALALLAAPAQAQSSAGDFADPAHFRLQDGGALYRDICQSCHMAEAQGAVGAGAYPALARNKKLASAGYPVLVVLQGSKGMPGFAAMLDDAQVAAVVNYVRTHFGNGYTDAVSAADVASARQ